MASAPSLSITAENPLANPDWNARLSGFPQAGFFHTAEWAEVLARTYGYTPSYFTASQDARPVSVLPVMEVNSWLTGRRGVSLPFTDCCAVLGSGGGIRAVFQEAIRLGESRRWKYLECRASAFPDLFDNPRPSLSFLTHQVELPADPEQLFPRFDSSVRRAIRKAEKSGVTVEMSTTPQAVREYYRLHCQTRREQGMPPQPFRLFQNIQEAILARNRGVVVSARYREQTVASAVYFQFGTEAIYKFGASDPDFLPLRANNLVMWEAIKWLARRGMRTLHFGRTSLANEGLRRYKLGWAAAEQRMDYHKYDLRTQTFLRDHDNAHGWHNQMFGRLPVFANRWLGALMYKHVG